MVARTTCRVKPLSTVLSMDSRVSDLSPLLWPLRSTRRAYAKASLVLPPTLVTSEDRTFPTLTKRTREENQTTRRPPAFVTKDLASAAVLLRLLGAVVELRSCSFGLF